MSESCKGDGRYGQINSRTSTTSIVFYPVTPRTCCAQMSAAFARIRLWFQIGCRVASSTSGRLFRSPTLSVTKTSLPRQKCARKSRAQGPRTERDPKISSSLNRLRCFVPLGGMLDLRIVALTTPLSGVSIMKMAYSTLVR